MRILIQLELFTLLFFVLIPASKISSQDINKIAVRMENQTADTIFIKTRVRTKLANPSAVLRDVPVGIVDFRIKQLALGDGEPVLSIFYGRDKERKRMIAFDSNLDGSLTNEVLIFFPEDNKYDRKTEHERLDSINPIQIIHPNFHSIYLKPVVSNCCARYSSSEDSIWHLFVETSYHKEGKFQINNNIFKIFLSPSPKFTFDLDRSRFYTTSDGELVKEQNDNPPYKAKQTAFVVNESFLFDSVSRYGDSVWIIHRKRPDLAVGNRPGLYAADFKALTTQRKPLTLSSLKGSYILLDFWGSWCIPCIQLIPELKSLQAEYKNKNLKVVSIAYDTRANSKKLDAIIRKNKMDWTHIYTDMSRGDNLSRLFDVDCYPTTILIDKTGKIIFRSCGEQEFSKLVAAVKQNLN